MAQFLNRKNLVEWIPKLIETAERELIIISPYIQISDNIFSQLKSAEKRGVEITLIYKEEELSDKERKRFNEIGNLNLLFHANLHSKCIYNEKYLLITSMNLYEFSQKHNREMGVLFRRTDEEQNGWNDYKFAQDDESVFQDAIEEIQSIINSAEFEKESFETKTIGFEMNIIKSKKDLAVDKCNRLNKYSKNKKFTVFQDGEEWFCKCNNFVDGVDMTIVNHRILLQLNFDEERIERIFGELNTKNYENYNDFRVIDCFRLFWTSQKSSPKLYSYTDHYIWDCDIESKEFFEGYFKGLNEFFGILRKEIIKTKN